MKNPLTWSIAASLLGVVGALGRLLSPDAGGSGGGGGSGAPPPTPPSKAHPDDATPVPPLTAKRVEEYALVGGTDEEIADRFLVTPALIRERFEPVLRSNRGLHALLLRAAQFNDATKELSTSMLTWLGRNELGQSNVPIKPGEPEPELEEKVG